MQLDAIWFPPECHPEQPLIKARKAWKKKTCIPVLNLPQIVLHCTSTKISGYSFRWEMWQGKSFLACTCGLFTCTKRKDMTKRVHLWLYKQQNLSVSRCLCFHCKDLVVMSWTGPWVMAGNLSFCWGYQWSCSKLSSQLSSPWTWRWLSHWCLHHSQGDWSRMVAQPSDGTPHESGMRARGEREVKVSGKPRHTREEVLANVHQDCC